MQTNPEKYSKGVLAAAKDIVKTEGAAFLLSGLGEYKYHSVTTPGAFWTLFASSFVESLALYLLFNIRYNWFIPRPYSSWIWPRGSPQVRIL